jgi:hypothetical protein
MNSVKSILGSYLGHLGGYIVAAASIVSGLDPKLVPPQYSFLTAVAGAVVIASHHSYQAGANSVITAGANAVATAIAQTPVKLAMAALMIACTLGMVTGLTACKTAPTANQQAGIIVAVDIAAGLAVQQHDTDPVKWKARAVEYKAIAVELKTLNDAGTATLATLAADLAPMVAKLPPADQLAASAMEAALIPYLQSQIPGNANVQNAQTTVDVVLAALIGAFEAYGA